MNVANLSPLQHQETEFEKRRGISRVEIRYGFAQVHITNLEGEIQAARLRVLKAVNEAGISVDFLKLTPTGLSFLVTNNCADGVATAIQPVATDSSIRPERAIVLVHAVNIRDEEGLIGHIVREVIETGTTIDHIGDMHDRLLMIVSAKDAPRLEKLLTEKLLAGQE